MTDYSIGIRKIKQHLARIRDNEIRRKAELMLAIMQARNIHYGCRHEGVCRKTFYAWHKRLREASYDIQALKNRPRGCRISPKRTARSIEEDLCRIRKEFGGAGGRIAVSILRRRTGVKIAHSTADRIFARSRLVDPYKTKEINPHTKLYASQNPMDRAQVDSVGLKIDDEHGNRLYAITAIDCCSRLAYLHCCREKSTEEARRALEHFLETVGEPKLVQTDNGVEFTYRFVSRANPRRQKEERYAPFEQLLAERGIRHFLIKPRTPEHNGKVERFHRTLIRYIRHQDLDSQPYDRIEKALQKFVRFYNEERPHSSLNGLTPREVFGRLPSQSAA